MKEFLLLFRSATSSSDTPPSPEQMQATMKQWQDWLGGLAAQDKIANMGNRLHSAGKVVRNSNVVTDGPFVEIKESLGGYSIVKAASLDEAAKIASGCPIYEVGGSVEVREIA